MKKDYLKPEVEIVSVRLYGSVLDREHDGLDVVSGEGNGIIYIGGKENGGDIWDDIDDEETIGKPNLWEDDEDEASDY
jgi:hypothetical protein